MAFLGIVEIGDDNWHPCKINLLVSHPEGALVPCHT